MDANEELQAYREDLARFKEDRAALDGKGQRRIVSSGYVSDNDSHPDALLRQPVNRGRKSLYGEAE